MLDAQVENPFADFCYREKRVRVNWMPNIPYFINFGHNVPFTNAHVSLYCFTHAQVNEIMLSGSVKGWKPIHYSAELVIDCDTILATEQVEAVLRSESISFDKYVSGNKGFHYHVPREAVPSEHLCLQDQLLVERLFPGVELDTGIYRPMHLIRGVGCYHEKTGRPKKLVDKFEGSNVLSVLGLTPTQNQIEWMRYASGADDRSEWGRFQDRVLLHQAVGGKGKRNLAIYCLAKDMYRSGLSVDTVLELCVLFNSAHQHPHEEAEVRRAAMNGISQVGER